MKPGMWIRVGGLLIASLVIRPAWGQTGAEITTATGIRTGVAIHVGTTDGALENELAATGRFVVQGVAGDEATLTKAREALVAAQNGMSVVALPEGGRLPYGDRVANLVVCDPAALGARTPNREELLRILAPTGALYIREQGRWSVVRGVKLAGAVEWPTVDGGAGTPYASADAALQMPLGVQWIDGPMIGQTPAEVDTFNTVSVGGRLFSLTNIDDANIATDRFKRPIYLVARDAYNGTRLWRRPYVPVEPMKYVRAQPPGYLGALDDRVFLVGPKGELLILDAATGTEIKTVTPKSPRRKPASKGGMASTLLVQGGLVMLQVEGGWEAYTPAGEFRWSVAATEKHYLASDQVLALLEENALRVIDIGTGVQRWTVTVPSPPERSANKVALVHDQVVVAVLPGKLNAYALTDGKLLWSNDIDAAKQRALVIPWRGGLAVGDSWLDLLTGKTLGKAPNFQIGQCTPPMVLSTFAIAGGKRGQLVDSTGLSLGKNFTYGAIRLPCSVPAIVANGLIYSFASDCGCGNAHVRGFSAHGRVGAEVCNAKFDGPRPLITGPGQPATVAISATKEWPMYRQNLRRSAALDCDPVRQPRELWRTPLGKTPATNLVTGARRVCNLDGLRGLTSAGGVVCVADADRLRVVALDAANGKERWAVNTGGVVDSPPTLAAGRVVFGSRDGWVYCHSLTDGGLIWRSRAAPEEAYVPAYGLIESRWPVVGSVSIQDGVVYASAGRTIAIDGGLALCAFALADGKLLWARNSLPESYNLRYRCPHNDVFISDDKGLRFNGATLEKSSAQGVVFPSDMLKPAAEGLVHHTRMNQDSEYHSYSWVPMAYGGVYARNLAWHNGRIFGFARFVTAMITNGSVTSNKTPLFGALANTDRPLPALLGNKTDYSGPPDEWTADLPDGTQGAGFIIQRDVAVAGVNVPENGQLTGRLLTFDLVTGKLLAEVKLDTSIALDGLIGTDGRLFVACEDRTVRCFGPSK